MKKGIFIVLILLLASCSAASNKSNTPVDNIPKDEETLVRNDETHYDPERGIAYYDYMDSNECYKGPETDLKYKDINLDTLEFKDISNKVNLCVRYPNNAPALSPKEEEPITYGKKWFDAFEWLENSNDPNVQDWVEEQDALARNTMAVIPARVVYHKKLKELLYVDKVSTPYRAGEYLFYTKRGKTEEKSIIYVKKDGENERILLDPAALSEDGSVAIGGYQPSRNGKVLAYSMNKNNADSAIMRFIDVETGENLPDIILGARYANPSWLKDNSGFYYTYFPEDETIPVQDRPGQTTIRFHQMGTDQINDTIIKPALNDPTKFHDINLSLDGNWLTYTIEHGWNGSEVYIKHIDAKEWSQLPVSADKHYYPYIHDGALYLLTDENAPFSKLVKIPLTRDINQNINLNTDQWKTIIPESDTIIEDFKIVSNRIIISGMHNVINSIAIYDLDGNKLHDVSIPNNGSVSTLYGKPIDENAYFSFQSFNTPPTIFSINPQTNALSTWYKTETAANLDAVVSEQHWATSKDGTQIPFFLVRHKDTTPNPETPTILYGYGGFNVAIKPVFDPKIHPWLERGGIFVYANLRGGSEFGENWHNAGKGFHKQNVFDDYYAIAEYLFENKFTSSKKLGAYGGSNGGLLVGAAITQRPEYFKAAVSAVPLLDMLKYHQFGSGKTWISEYMSPDASENAFNYLKSYSPYANLANSNGFPSTLFLSAKNDDRVDPMHARKMNARMQNAPSQHGYVFLRTEKNSGHGGADMVKQKIEEAADMFTFFDYFLHLN